MYNFIRLILLLFLPVTALAQVPTVANPVPVNAVNFSWKHSVLYKSQVSDPLIVKVWVDESGTCDSVLVVHMGSHFYQPNQIERIREIRFFPGRWGAEFVQRTAYLAFSVKPREQSIDWAKYTPDEINPVHYHFHTEMEGFEKEKEEYLWYEHIHRHLYPPVGYEESDENGDFTETIEYHSIPHIDDIPKHNTFHEGEYPEPQDMGDFRDHLDYDEISHLEIYGRIYLRVLIDMEGMPSRYMVMRGIHPLIDEKVTTAIRKLRFKPATNPNGKATYCWVTFPVKFEPPK